MRGAGGAALRTDRPVGPWCSEGGRPLGSQHADTRSAETHGPCDAGTHRGALGREAPGLGTVRREGPSKRAVVREDAGGEP